MTTDAFLDWQLVVCIFALFGMAVGVIVYWIGYSHGREVGYEAGCADEITRLKPRVISAKKEGAKIMRAVCAAEFNQALAIPTEKEN